MTKNLTAIALERGYRIELEPEYLYVPRIGAFRLPLWFAAVKKFVSPKGTRYSVEAFANKVSCKANRAKLKMMLKERKRIFKERQLRNEQLRNQRNGN